MRLIALSLLLGVASGPLLATPSAESACEYFSRELLVEANISATPISGNDLQPFQRQATELERYTQFTRSEAFQEFGIVTPKNEIMPTAHAAWTSICLVDEVDRRVLHIAIINGPSVGSAVEMSNGQQRKVQGVAPKVLLVGDQPHQGKY